MSRVLLVCPEPLGHRQPAGIGIRFLEMAGVLRADGHEVAVLSPGGGSVEGCRAGDLSAETIQEQTGFADVAVVQGHAANDLFAHGRPIPVVVDLYDPFIIENLHYFRERGAEVFTHDHATLVNALVRGDFFLCASEAQRLFYVGLLLATGRVNPASFESDRELRSLIAIAPFGVQQARSRNAAGGNAILFGGIYDWYDPLTAIDAVAQVRRSIPDATLAFTHHPNPDLTPQGKTAEAMEYVRHKGYGDFVRFESWTPYEQRGEFFDRYDVALLTFPPSLETDLSMRTRIYDYLWGGLPVVTSPASGTDAILHRYGAGAVVPTNSADAFATRILSILSDGAVRERMSAGAARFVTDHAWPSALAPLRAFCRDPRFEPTREAFAMRLELPPHAPSILTRLKRRIGGGF